jgi:ABC-type cobalt transport system substrate-binding protein
MGVENKGYFLKIVADGYDPCVSRLIEPQEGNVELNFALQPASAATSQRE